LEHFFDLVFVLAIAELAHYLHDHLTPGGFLGFAFLFLPVWLVWSNFSYYADLYDVDGPLYRVTMRVTMLFSIALAVNIHGALDGGSVGFATSYVASGRRCTSRMGREGSKASLLHNEVSEDVTANPTTTSFFVATNIRLVLLSSVIRLSHVSGTGAGPAHASTWATE
jgi:low temperature requirement protein LtrA